MVPSYKNSPGMDTNSSSHSRTVDLGIAWTWKYDAPFVRSLVNAADERGVTVLQITEGTVEETTRAVLDGDLRIRWFFDRASDEDDAYRSLASYVLRDHRSGGHGRMRFINPTDAARRAADKATMHLEFLTNNVHVPDTIILPAYAEQPDIHITDADLERLGTPFVIKPANTTGGGTGVVPNARTLGDIQRHRMTFEQDKYLVQRRIVPVYLSEARAWFRVFYAFGGSRICWWDDETHIYDEVSSDEERWFGLEELHDAIGTIAEVCRLDFFSSEFAQTVEGVYVSVDYVNELCDMRPKSSAQDGVPDSLLEWVARQMAEHVAKSDPAEMTKA